MSRVLFVEALRRFANARWLQNESLYWNADLVHLFEGPHRDMQHGLEPDAVRHRLPFFVDENDLEDLESVWWHLDRAPFSKDIMISSMESKALKNQFSLDVFFVSSSDIALTYDMYRGILRYLADNPSSYRLESLDDGSCVTGVDPFSSDLFGSHYQLNVMNSTLSTPNASYRLYIDAEMLKEYCASGEIRGRIGVGAVPDYKIDTNYFVSLMHKHKWDWNKDQPNKKACPKVIGRHGGKSEYILQVVLPKYHKRYPDHLFKDRSFTDNKEISAAFRMIQNEIRFQMPAYIEGKDSIDEAFLRWLMRVNSPYKWKWHVVLGFKPQTSKEMAVKALSGFFERLTLHWRKLREDGSSRIAADKAEIYRLVIMEKESGNGNLHVHILFGEEISKSMKAGIANLWEGTQVVLKEEGDAYNCCERPRDTENGGWFERIYCIYGIVRYVLKEKSGDQLSEAVTELEGIAKFPKEGLAIKV